MKPVLFFLTVAQVLSAQPPSTYDIRRASAPIVIDGRLDDAAWREAPPAGDFHFTWWKEGDKEQTVARLLWDDENLYVGYFCHDKHISAYVTQRHGAVSKDDCVEIFLSPNPDKVTNYYTFEINAIGTMLNRCRTDWWSGPPTWEPEDVRHRTSFHGLPKKDESPGDDHWAVEMAIPFKNFARDAEHTPPRDGDRWRLNLNRTGGVTNRQSSSWSPIATPAPAFHTPSAFGWVRFVGTSAASPQRRNPQSAAEGRELYNRNCTMCHGLDGEAGDRAPALAATRRYLRTSEHDLFEAIRHGIPGTMMPPTALPDGDVRKIVAYIQSLRATAFEEDVAGNAAAGEKVFAARCSNCHTINGRGGLLGPDLSDIGGTRRLAVLRETLTKPLPYVPRGYQPVTVVTTDGRSIRGLAKNENNFSLQIMDMDGKLHLFQRDELREISHDKQSIMPRNFDQVLRPEELQDLLAFLSRQARSKMQ